MCAQLTEVQVHTKPIVPPVDNAATHVIPENGTSILQQVMLDGVSWKTYESLLMDYSERSGTHFAYHHGNLEITVLSPQHESLKHTLSQLVDIFAEELDLDIQGLGSTTFRREEARSGFEPDACFYFENAAQIRGKAEIDLTADPAPELIIEINLTSFSLDKFPIFAAMGIQEVWRYDGGSVLIYALNNGTYVEQTVSSILRPVSSQTLTNFVVSGQELPRPQWLRQVRGWIREQLQNQG